MHKVHSNGWKWFGCVQMDWQTGSRRTSWKSNPLDYITAAGCLKHSLFWMREPGGGAVQQRAGISEAPGRWGEDVRAHKSLSLRLNLLSADQCQQSILGKRSSWGAFLPICFVPRQQSIKGIRSRGCGILRIQQAFSFTLIKYINLS